MTDERTDGDHYHYLPSPSAGDNKTAQKLSSHNLLFAVFEVMPHVGCMGTVQTTGLGTPSKTGRGGGGQWVVAGDGVIINIPYY